MMQIPDFERAFDAYVENPTHETAHEVLIRMRELAFARGASAVGPMMAITEFSLSRGHCKKVILPQTWLWICKWLTARSRPAWNDYWMTLWMLRRDAESLIEIHRRVAHLKVKNAKWYAVQSTAEWMVASQKETNPHFRYAMEIVEGRCPMCTGRPVVS